MDQNEVQSLSDLALIEALKTLKGAKVQAMLEREMIRRGLGAHLIDGDGKALFMYRTKPYPNKAQAAMEEEQTGAS